MIGDARNCVINISHERDSIPLFVCNRADLRRTERPVRHPPVYADANVAARIDEIYCGKPGKFASRNRGVICRLFAKRRCSVPNATS